MCKNGRKPLWAMKILNWDWTGSLELRINESNVLDKFWHKANESLAI